MASFHIIFEFTVAVLAAIISATSGKLFLNIGENKDSVLAKFKLKSDQTFHDFAVFYVGEFLLLITFMMYVIVGLTQQSSLLSFARVLLVLFLSIIAYGTIRMWRRSR